MKKKTCGPCVSFENFSKTFWNWRKQVVLTIFFFGLFWPRYDHFVKKWTSFLPQILKGWEYKVVLLFHFGQDMAILEKCLDSCMTKHFNHIWVFFLWQKFKCFYMNNKKILWDKKYLWRQSKLLFFRGHL